MKDNCRKNIPNSGFYSNHHNNFLIHTHTNSLNINNQNTYKPQINTNKPLSLKNTFTKDNRVSTFNKMNNNLNFSNNSINSFDKESTNNMDEQSNASNLSLKSMINKIQYSNKEISFPNLKNAKCASNSLNNSGMSQNENTNSKFNYKSSIRPNSISNSVDIKQISLMIKEKIEKSKINEEIILPPVQISLDSLNITKPIKIKGQENSSIYINEGPIEIDFEASSNIIINNNINMKNNNIVKFSQIQIIYNDSKSNKEKKITPLFKIHPSSFLELEDCDIVFQSNKNEHISSAPPTFLGGYKDKKSVAFLLFSNKKDDKIKKFNPIVLNLTNTRVHNFYQSIRAGQNCIININKSAFIQNYGKAIVMLNPIFLKVSETLFEYNEDNNIHIKFLEECLYEEKRKLFFNKNNFDKSIGNDICIEGIKHEKLDLSIVITKNNFHNGLTDGVLIYDLIYNYFEITDNSFLKNKGNGLNIQKCFFNKINTNNYLYQPIKIKDNQFIENKQFGSFINDCIIEAISNKFTLNRQSGMILCNIIIDDPKKGLEGINLSSNKGNFISIIKSIKKSSMILKNTFFENGDCGLYIYGYPYQVNIQESVFNSNCKHGISVDLDCIYSNNNINNFYSKLNEFKSITQIQKINDLLNIYLNKCILEKNMKNGIFLNLCLIYCEETFIINNLNYAISIKKKEYQNCFKQGKKNLINGSIGGEWGEINLNKETHCGFGCMPKSELNYKKKEEIIKKVPNYLNQSEDNRSIDETSKRRKEFSLNDITSNNSERVYMKRPSAPVNKNNNNNKDDEGGCVIF